MKKLKISRLTPDSRYLQTVALKALITQNEAPNFFFTFSAADNYWPDLHRLLQEPNNATPSIRIKAVIDNPHLTDSYFVSRLDQFSNVWLDRVLDTEWKWLRFEWQARGSIHAHGCAKLRNDPGLCNLVNAAVQGWKLEQILQLQLHQPTYEQMAAVFYFPNICGQLPRHRRHRFTRHHERNVASPYHPKFFLTMV